MEIQSWLPFTRKPTAGVYWVAGICPEIVFDVDDYGRYVKKYTGANEPFISLVLLNVKKDGEVEVEPVNRYETGDFDNEYVITHIMKLKIPEHPEGGAK